jgi:DNA modification methylase
MNLPLNQIIQGDCLEILKTFPAASVDMVLTSPPYDNLREYKGYTFNFEGIAKELYRVVKDGGVVVWVVNDATINGSETGTSFKQALYFKEIGFNLHDTMIWRRRTLPQNSMRYEPAFEYMFIFSKRAPKTFNAIRIPATYEDNRKEKNYHRTDDGFSRNQFTRQEMVVKENIWDIPNRGNDEISHEHPAIFPEKLAADHIKSWSNEGDLVLDPMCGSGTTCKMAQRLGRNFIGIDVSEEYCKIARDRVKQEILI